MTTTLTVPADATSEHLLGYLHASKDWEHLLSYGADEWWATTYYRTEGPFKGYKIDVPQHDEDPDWLRDAAAVINGIEHGQMPACGLSQSKLSKAVTVLRSIVGSGRTERVELSEAVTLMGVMDPWYGASENALSVLGAITRGMHLSQLDVHRQTTLSLLTAHLERLLALSSDPIDVHPAMLRGEVTAETVLSCCYGQHYDNPGTAYIHDRCGRLLRPWGDVHEHKLCACFGPAEPWMAETRDAHMTVIQVA